MTLKEWVQSKHKPYSEGLKLLNQIGCSPVLINVLSKSESAFNKNKITSLLSEALLNSEPAAPKAEKSHPAETKTSVVATKQVPEELQAIVSTRIGAFKKMAALHQELINIKGNGPKAIEARYKLQLEIIRLDELNEECWEQVHYYEKHGKLPVGQNQFNPESLTIRELVNLEKTIPSYITKYNKELAQPELSEQRRDELTKRVTEWQIKAQTIKLIIDRLPELSKVKEALC